MTRHWIITTLLIISPVNLSLADSKLTDIHSLDQNMFRDLTANLGSTLGYKAINPSQPLGDLAGENLILPSIHVFKGLPYAVDVGGFYSTLPASDTTLMGGELGYGLINGYQDIPDVSIRGTYTQLTGVQDLSLSTHGLELSISKGFDLITPYAGIGSVWIEGDPGIAGLEAEQLREDKYFLGFSLNLGDMNFAAETEMTGDTTTTSARFGARF